MKTWKESFDFFKSGMQVQLGGPLINLLFVLSYLVKSVHNDPISYFSCLLVGESFDNEDDTKIAIS